MGEPDVLDRFRDRLAGQVDAAVLDAAIAEVRGRYGGKTVLIHSGTQARHVLILDALAGGATVEAVAKRFGLTRQAIIYIRKKKRLAEPCS